jgi:hypothetical protein
LGYIENIIGINLKNHLIIQKNIRGTVPILAFFSILGSVTQEFAD